MSISVGLALAERGLLPEAVLRRGIRRLLARRLRDPDPPGFRASLREGPIALAVDKANEQHYEVPAAFFALVLGRRLKYSGSYWPPGTENLDEAEERMLALYAERAQLTDGQRVLDLGCGWGSLSLWIAEHYPASRIVAVSNSATQRSFIEARRPRNLEVVTADMNDFAPDGVFDRIVSIEMLEHMHNYARLFERIASWLADEGRFFVHVFCHRSRTYPFETEGADNWMGRHFFTGGLMPAFDLLPSFDDHLCTDASWQVDGRHYARTAEAWLRLLEARRSAVVPILATTYGPREARRWFHRWRLFFLACAELFGWGGGTEWFVGHYRFARRR